MTTVLERLCAAEDLCDALDSARRAACRLNEPEWTSVIEDLMNEIDEERERLNAVYAAEEEREEAYARRITE